MKLPSLGLRRRARRNAETMDMLDALAIDLEADDDGARSLDESFGPEVFPLTDDATLEMSQGRGRRLVLVPMPGESPHSHPDVELLEEALGSIDDTESVAVQDLGSEVGEDETFALASVPDPLVMATRGWTPAVRAALVWLDEVHLDAVFIRRAVVMKIVPKFLRGPYRSAMQLAMEEALHENDHRRERGWKLFLLLPRLLFFRPARVGNIHKGKLAQRFQNFSEGGWSELLRVSTPKMRRKHRAGSDDTTLWSKSWIAGLPGLCHLCKCVRSRQDVKHWKALFWHQEHNVPRDPLPHTVVGHMPDVRFSLEEYRFAANLRSSR